MKNSTTFKKRMQKLTILLAFVPILSFAQPGNTLHWKLGGNLGTGIDAVNATNNILGTIPNLPLLFHTNGVQRTRLNGNLITPINGVNQNVSGFMGLSPNGYFANNSPITLLHLMGPDNSSFGIGGGWRKWMSTGIFINEHSDGMYVGMKPVLGTTNRSNAVINWNDDPFAGVVDKLSFVFTQANNGNGTGTNPINSNSLNGYEFMLMAPSTTVFNSQGTGEGTIGVGPVFTDAAPPQSRFHINAEERMNNWLQISNQLGTGQANSDGLRIGINGDLNPNINGNAFIYNQETKHLLFSTNANTNALNIGSGNTRERMRITSISAPTNLAGGGYGVYNPGALPINTTRAAISHNPNTPVTRPLSLLHLGYNTGLVGFTPTSTDGWRNWMDIGTFTSNGTDNMYVGLKREAGGFPTNDRHDAVINWGDNGGNNPLTGSDNLRFIFTETQTSTIPGNAPATTNNGLEVARFDPKLATTLTAPNYGMMGIGDWTTAFNILPANVIDAKLDIDGDLRIREVTERDTLLQVLVIDSNDRNRVHWRSIASLGNGINCWDTNGNGINDPNEDTNNDGVFDALDCQGATGPQGPVGPQGPAGPSGGGTVTADNGLSIFPASSNNVQLGGTLIKLTNIDMNSFNMNFTNTGRYFIGGTGNSKLVVKNDATPWANIAMFTSSGSGLNRMTIAESGLTTINTQNSGGLTIDANVNFPNVWNVNARIITNAGVNAGNSQSGVQGLVSQIFGDIVGTHIGVSSLPTNHSGHNIAFHTKIGGANNPILGNNTAFNATLLNGENNYGVDVFVKSGRTSNYGVRANVGANGPNDPTVGTGTSFGVNSLAELSNINYGGNFLARNGASENYGIKTQGNGSNSINYGIWASAGGTGSTNWAGWFQGHVNVTGTLFANNGIFATSDQQFKQNIQPLTNATTLLSQLTPKTFDYDSTNFTRFNFDTNNHMGLIAQEVNNVLPSLVKESILPAEFDSLGNQTSAAVNYKSLNYQELIPLLIAGFNEQQSLITNKDSIIDNLEDRLATLEACINNIGICNNNGGGNGNKISAQTVTLENTTSIVLDQNLPNPFAESTQINYVLPDDVLNAKMLFYDMNGRIINEVTINERGNGTLTVYGENLEKGIYTYSLIADGKLIATKKMVKK